MRYKNLLELLDQAKESKAGITFIKDSDEEEFMSYRQLHEQSRKILCSLKKEGLQKGCELIFQIEDEKTFILVFWACVFGGIIPVPVTMGGVNEQKRKVLNIWRTLNNPYLITTEKTLNNYLESEQLYEHQTHIKQRVLFIEEILELDGDSDEIGVIDENEIAFIQFSSGSTGLPKGVTLTHQNLMTNIRAIVSGMAIVEDDRGLTWLPLTHDLGLIGFHLVPLFKKNDQFIMSTNLFVRRPLLWLSKISEHRITTTASPNFGYAYTMMRLKDNVKYDWDLSCLKLIANGAEPISAQVCRDFFMKMERYGLKKNVLFNTFGMAEASLAVTFPPPGEGLKSILFNRESLSIGCKVLECQDEMAVELVDLGTPVMNCYVKITDVNGIEVDQEIVGHIHIKGNNVTKGYYNNHEMTASVITSGGWLNTGDLGFLKAGRLFVCGRVKDIIFIHGKNYYSNDVEHSIERLCGMKSGTLATVGVFSEHHQRDIVLLFVRFNNKLADFITIENDIRKKADFKIGFKIDVIIPIKRLPKTTSGKLKRYELIENYQKKEYQKIIEELRQLKDSCQLTMDKDE